MRVGGVIALPLHGRVRVLRVLALPERRGPPAEARLAFEEIEAGRIAEQAAVDDAAPAS